MPSLERPEQNTLLDLAVDADDGGIDPFLRWAGGKRWLVPQILQILGGRTFSRYHEPFLGGGALFFGMKTPQEVFLTDLNTDLIEVYTQVRDNPREVAAKLGAYRNSAEDYYAARSEQPSTGIERAARFIFLNHTSFNGIYRVNLRGVYNVPFGHRKSINAPSEDRLLGVSKRLQGAHLAAGDFERALGDVGKGDLVFLDPPYTVAHNNNGFVKYNQHLFSFDDQVRLAESIERISKLGASFILTNAAHTSIEELFSPLGRRITVSRKNSIGGKQAARGSAEEYVFTNIEAK